MLGVHEIVDRVSDSVRHTVSASWPLGVHVHDMLRKRRQRESGEAGSSRGRVRSGETTEGLAMLPNDLLKRILARIIVDEWEHHNGVNRRERTRISLVCKLWYRLRGELVVASARCIEDPEVAEFYRLENWRTRNRWYRTNLGHTAIFPDYERLYLAADDVAAGFDTYEEWPPSARDRRYKKRCIAQRTRCHRFADKAEETLEFLHKYEEEFEKRVFEAANKWLKPFYVRMATQ